MRRLNWFRVAFTVVAALGLAVGQAAEPAAPPKPRGVLDILAAMTRSVRPVEETMAAAMERGDVATAERLSRKLIADVPFAPSGYYNLACVLAIRNKPDEAFGQLEAAVAHGFNNVEHLKTDPDLITLRGDPRFAGILKKAREAPPLLPFGTPQPYVVTDQTAWAATRTRPWTATRGCCARPSATRCPGPPTCPSRRSPARRATCCGSGRRNIPSPATWAICTTTATAGTPCWTASCSRK